MQIGKYLDIEPVPLFFVTHSQTHKQFSHWSFHNPECLRNLQKKFRPIGGKNCGTYIP